MATLSKNPILVDFFDPENGQWNSHVDLGSWSDLYVIAPATANSMGKMAHAVADNLLITTYLSAKCAVMIAPAMDLDMFQHPATQNNIAKLVERGHICIDATTGELASGLSGKGRMAEPEAIYERLENYFNSSNSLKGKKILITAGPTHENIDPVRFIGNYSSGKMGYAIAEECLKNGAEVLLISGPVNIIEPKGNIRVINIRSAQQMFDACVDNFNDFDVAIMNAAVADYTPEITYNKKFKRKDDNLQIKLKATKDIAAELGKQKKPGQILIGFALETDNEINNAKLKLTKKNLDFIVLNSLNDKGAGFSLDTNKITIVDKNKNIEKFDLKLKSEVAEDIIQKLVAFL